MPESPLVFARKVLCRPHFARQQPQHEECKFGGGFGQNVGGVGEGNLIAVRVGAINVVESDGELRDNFECALASLEKFCIDLIA